MLNNKQKKEIDSLVETIDFRFRKKNKEVGRHSLIQLSYPLILIKHV